MTPIPPSAGVASCIPIHQHAGFRVVAVSTCSLSVGLYLVGELRNDADIGVETARWLMIAILVSFGLVFVAGLWKARHCTASRPGIFVILVVGLLSRLVLVPSDPAFSSDFNRYLLDGATTALGVNPYRFAPESLTAAMRDPASASNVPSRLVERARESGPILRRVNHPHLSTIYPPAAPAIFAASYTLKPWSLAICRIVLLAFDLATVVLLWRLMRAFGAPAHAIAWFWWNPIVLRVIAHIAHMDAIVLPFAVGAVPCAHRRRHIAASIVLAFAVGIKIWPLVLLPLIALRSVRFRSAVFNVIVFSIVSVVLWIPVGTTWSEPANSSTAYTSSWQNNSAFFVAVRWLVEQSLELLSFAPYRAERSTRVVIGALLFGWTIACTWRMGDQYHAVTHRALALTAGVFLLRPAQFPWYYTWIIPFLCTRPSLPLLSYSALLPLYYAIRRHSWLVWIEHTPVAAWLTVQYVWHRRSMQAPETSQAK